MSATIEVSIMRPIIRNALLATAGLVALSLSAQAAGTPTVTDTPTVTTDPSLVKEARGPGVHGFRSENPGGAGYKKKKKKSSQK